VIVSACHFFEKQCRVHDFEIVLTKRAHAHHTKIGVAHHDRIGCSPFVARENARGNVINIGLKRRFETIFPAEDRRQHWNVRGGQRVLAWAERIGVFTEINKLRHLALAHDQLRVVLNLFVLIGPAIGQRIA
jgi:hypothetical protein